MLKHQLQGLHIYRMIFSLNYLRAESLLLSVMACDRLAAIQKALHTGTLLGGRACVHTAAAALGQGVAQPSSTRKCGTETGSEAAKTKPVSYEVGILAGTGA